MPERLGRWRAPAWVDPAAGLVLGILTAAPLAGSLRGVLPWAATLTAAAAVTVAVTVRGRHPLPSLVGVSLVMLLARALHGRPEATTAGIVGVLLVIYSAAARRPLREASLGFAVAVAALLGIAALGPSFDPAPPLVLTVPVFCCGRALRRWRLLTHALRERTAALAAEREAHAALAVRDERMRIARELHDVVGHALSLMVVQASAGHRVAATRPDDARRALDAIDAAGAQALGDLARLAVLVADEPTGGAALAELIEHGRQAGLEIRLRDESGPAPDPLALRIVQEGLTNALKHAGSTTVEIELRRSGDGLTIRVADHGPCAGAPPAAPSSSGFGLRGMRERVALVGGSLRAGSRAGGGWEIVARLPGAGGHSGEAGDGGRAPVAIATPPIPPTTVTLA